MQAAGKAQTPEDRKRLRRKCAELIQLGERLKAGAGADTEARPAAAMPESTRPLTTLEKTIVLRASRLHGSVFPPWDSALGTENSVGTGPLYVFVYMLWGMAGSSSSR